MTEHAAAVAESSIARGSVGAWILAARPKTLSAAAVPVFVGTALAHAHGGLRWAPALAALFGALLLQIGANFANDVFDYEKGADTEARLGPTRAVQAGLLSPSAVRFGMMVVFALATLLGVYLTSVSGPWILGIGLLSIASAVLYTGGPYPLGYHGLGDLFVFIFFGLVAVVGTTYVECGKVTLLALLSALPVGALATAILVVNNLRDIATDRQSGKRTLAVRFGERGAIGEYALLLAVAYLVPVLLVLLGLLRWPVLLPWMSLPLGLRLLQKVASERGRALNPLLARTAQLLLVYGILFAAGIVLGSGSLP